METQNFYDAISSLFPNGISDNQQSGIEALLSGCDLFGVTDQRMRAYILGTCYWETGRTMQPIEEYGKGTGHLYGKMFKQNGQPYTSLNHIYYGRGFTQNTWFDNYEMLTNQNYAKAKGWDFLNNPELLLQVEPSVWATIHCMWNGSYTGVGLKTYFNDARTDYVNARKIINGLDQAEKIAGFAQTFATALAA